jgi:hypothetical protein
LKEENAALKETIDLERANAHSSSNISEVARSNQIQATQVSYYFYIFIL